MRTDVDEQFKEMMAAITITMERQQNASQSQSEMHDVRMARLDLATALIKQGIDPEIACERAKQLTVRLFGAPAN